MLPRLYPSVRPADLGEVLEKARTVPQGACADVLEKKLASILGAKGCLALTSGRTALRLATDLLPVKSGDEALLPAFTCPVVTDALITAGIIPVPVDLTLPDYRLDLTSLNTALTEKCKLVIPTAYFGLPLNIKPYEEYCRKNHLAVIIDTAQNLDLDFDWSAIARLAAQVPLLLLGSFNIDKHLPLGGGGFLAAFDSELAGRLAQAGERLELHTPEEDIADLSGLAVQLLLMQRQHYEGYLSFDTGRELVSAHNVPPEEARDICHSLADGENADRLFRRMSSLLKDSVPDDSPIKKRLRRLIPSYLSPPPQVALPKRMGRLKALLGEKQLDRLAEVNKARTKNGLLIHHALGALDKVWLPMLGEKGSPLIRYPLVMKKRPQATALIRALSLTGFEVGPFNYPQPLHQISIYRKYLRLTGSLKTSEEIAGGMINLPTWTGLSNDELEQMTNIIRNKLGAKR
jgi:dTDP-4-amino-4,6-dideoxygalactose transaminase